MLLNCIVRTTLSLDTDDGRFPERSAESRLHPPRWKIESAIGHGDDMRHPGTPNILPQRPVSVPRGTFTMGYELADSGARSGPKVPVRRVLGPGIVRLRSPPIVGDDEDSDLGTLGIGEIID